MEVMVLALKGFAFSLDAMIAVLVAVTALGVVAEIGGISHNTPTELVNLQYNAQDILTTMDKNGTFDLVMPMTTPNGNPILNTTMNKLLPVNSRGRLNFTVCTWNDPGFTCSKTFVVQTNTSEMTVKVQARRVVENLSDNTFGIATLDVGR